MKFVSALLAALAILVAAPALAEPAARVAIHVDDNDPERMNLALNNARNIWQYYRERDAEVQIAIVAIGPGLHMFRADTSPVAARISALKLEIPSLQFEGCMNTRDGMTKKEGTEPPMLEEVVMVPSGAIQLIQLQQQGWAYLKP